MKAIVQKPDLDTCLTALIMGVTEDDEVVVLRHEAPEADLMDSGVLCIEAGGSGLAHLNNFDHHNNADERLPSACRQAYGIKGLNDQRLSRLVDYVCMVDEGRPTGLETPAGGKAEFPLLSNIFSGMLLVERGPLRQFFKGVEILKRVLDAGIDPFGAMPDIEDWRAYRMAKEDNRRKLAEALKGAVYFSSRGGLRVGFVEADAPGVIGALYSQGCAVAVAYSPLFGEPPVGKYTVAGNGVEVHRIAEIFNKIEHGWGGQKTIIGSPRGGTSLDKENVLAIVRENL